MKKIIEVCVDTVDGGIEALDIGADRLELCSALGLGGLTPSLGSFIMLEEKYPGKTHVLIRPRMGNFIYNKVEKSNIESDCSLFAEYGCKELVIGALLENNSPDYEFLNKIVNLHPSINFTFHRALDELQDPDQHLHQLAEMGFRRILTSGGHNTALEGINNIATWQSKFGHLIEIMAGGGIAEHNIEEIFEISQINAAHLSLKEWFEPENTSHLNLNSTLFSGSGYWKMKKNDLKKILIKINQ
ncbi:MAG: copper homeostasis protein CutC [Saprospiraceae bacterium]|nr:copper homeostasis protein CutC [Saprospiraceae bacterium]